MGHKNSKVHKGGPPAGNKNARLPDLNWSEIDRLLAIGSIGEEVAAFLGIDYETLARHCKQEKGLSFEDYAKRGNTNFKVSLRRLQARAAAGYTEIIRDEENRIIRRQYNPPSVTMQIWLGKQFLNQSDRVEQTLTIPQINVQPSNADDVDEIEESLDKLGDEND